ncbi:MAG: hypothetical protein P8X68_11445 [Desulfobacterales bacterium]
MLETGTPQVIKGPDLPGGISKYHSDGNGNHDGIHVRRIDQAPEHQNFEDCPNEPGYGKAQHEHKPIGQLKVCNKGIGNKRAQDDHFTLGEVNDISRLINQHKANGHEGIHASHHATEYDLL